MLAYEQMITSASRCDYRIGIGHAIDIGVSKYVGKACKENLELSLVLTSQFPVQPPEKSRILILCLSRKRNQKMDTFYSLCRGC